MFDLQFSTSPGSDPIHQKIDAGDEAAAHAAAKRVIAQALGKPDAFVHLDGTGTFRAGAGYWSRSGRFSITPSRATR
ncbi:hypothetical protein EDF56_102499 [Novosphingobium sp. PhB165]|jgi:hypothetical protein|uniref:hypothetical protein n=1 Tax=Novosphingobium sp. PhB165 TaxID=2485105 RepID=UPI0010539D62|nr:hypothetical protein [Novosphingobium sp. PhB165]TCM20836.1 hypothetical protein EDF56_102499 [Novosphingobium sp. PhB165]